MSPKRPHFKPELIDNSKIQRAAYNPREADSFRDDMLKLSIAKFGWLIPAFVDPRDELLSGHQRQRISIALGATQTPVIRTKELPEGRRKAINLIFNRATNDMDTSDSSQNMRQKLLESKDDIIAEISELPDLDPQSEAFFPVMNFQWWNTQRLLDLNEDLGTYGMQTASQSLVGQKMITPLVITEAGEIINGKGRLPALAAAGFEEVPCSIVNEKYAESLKKLVNLLTMDFTIHKQYADVLRFNSFRRSYGTKDYIGSAFRFDLYPSDVDWQSDHAWTRWKKHYGTTVLDFGAGLLQDCYRLREQGVKSIPFEPFLLEKDGGNIDPDAARSLMREFLGHLKDGIIFDSIFQNSIMNSVPFESDRKKIVKIIAALCSDRTRVYACAASTKSCRASMMLGHKRSASQERVAPSAFQLDYEDNVSIAEVATLPKVQKFHSSRDWYDLWTTGFDWVKVTHWRDLECCVCKDPKPVTREEIIEAIEFEMDLKYPDGSSLGLVDEAKEAFGKYLGMDLLT
ncbi:MAG: ParB N-terminal domain-containing protein [bacterium]|nr:ParB N-terminal domain-containing protein [bacterium]